MFREADAAVRLSEYRPYDWLVDTVDLDFRLEPTATRVRAKLAMRPNPKGRKDVPIVLDGDELTLVSLNLDGRVLTANEYEVNASSLTIKNPPRGKLTLEIETVIDPSSNTKLMGLFRSNKIYCTQCEAEGFRRITYFPDRPDVLSVYTVRIEADRDEAPFLLSNGNPVEAFGIPDTNRHYAIWHDPHPKPAYLFALVGGKLDYIEEPFKTASGRSFRLQHGRDGKQGPEHLQRQICSRVARDRDRYRLREYRSDYRARIFSQLDRRPHHLPRLVPALSQGRTDRLPRSGIFVG